MIIYTAGRLTTAEGGAELRVIPLVSLDNFISMIIRRFLAWGYWLRLGYWLGLGVLEGR